MLPVQLFIYSRWRIGRASGWLPAQMGVLDLPAAPSFTCRRFARSRRDGARPPQTQNEATTPANIPFVILAPHAVVRLVRLQRRLGAVGVGPGAMRSHDEHRRPRPGWISST